jgi:hypothetical protein
VRRPIVIAILGLALLAVLTGAAAGNSSGVVASASGGYGMSGSAAGSTFVIHPFTFNVRVYEDGSADGRFNYTQVRDGVELTAKGSLDCAVIAGNQAWVGGVIEESSRESLVGLDMWFQVQDNGEPGSDETPDMSSTLGAGGPGTGNQYCADHPPVRFPFFLDAGNLQVRPAG